MACGVPFLNDFNEIAFAVTDYSAVAEGLFNLCGNYGAVIAVHYLNAECVSDCFGVHQRGVAVEDKDVFIGMCFNKRFSLHGGVRRTQRLGLNAYFAYTVCLGELADVEMEKL